MELESLENGISMHSWVDKDYVTTKAFRGWGEGRLKFFPCSGEVFPELVLPFHPAEF